MMKFRAIALAVLASTSFGAHAALQTVPAWDAAFPTIAGVLFNVSTNGGATVGLGAHAYKNGVFLPNNGVDTFTASSGIYAPDGLGRANWSFDFFYNMGTNCSGCTVTLSIDTDPTAGVNLVALPSSPAAAGADSWNMEMGFLSPLLAGYNFDPFAASSTAFRLEIRNSLGASVASTDITVNVPEPGSIALAGLALAGLGALRRRKA